MCTLTTPTPGEKGLEQIVAYSNISPARPTLNLLLLIGLGSTAASSFGMSGESYKLSDGSSYRHFESIWRERGGLLDSPWAASIYVN